MTLPLPLAAKRSKFATLNAELIRTTLRRGIMTPRPQENEQAWLVTLLADSITETANSLNQDISSASIDDATVRAQHLANEGCLLRLNQTRSELLLLDPDATSKWRRTDGCELMRGLERETDTRRWVLSTRERRPLSMITAGLIAGRTIDQISMDADEWLEPHALVSPIMIESMRWVVGQWLEELHHSPVDGVFSTGRQLRRLAFPKLIRSFLPERARQLVLEAHEAIEDGRAVAPARWDVLFPAARHTLHHALLLCHLDSLSLALEEIASRGRHSRGSLRDPAP